MRVNHPSIGRERVLSETERTAVNLYRAEEIERRYGGTEFGKWWRACKSESAATGEDAMSIRDASWTWAMHFHAYCMEV